MTKTLLHSPLMTFGLIGATCLITFGFTYGFVSARPALPTAGGGEQAIDIAKVPTEVLSAAKKYFIKFDGCKASTETEHGVKMYEIEGKSADGMGLDIAICANGQVAEVEQQISADALPADARANLARSYPGAKTLKAEMVERHSFEVQIEVDGKKKAVAIGASGSVAKGGEGDEEDEEDEKSEKK